MATESLSTQQRLDIFTRFIEAVQCIIPETCAPLRASIVASVMHIMGNAGNADRQKLEQLLSHGIREAFSYSTPSAKAMQKMLKDPKEFEQFVTRLAVQILGTTGDLNEDGIFLSRTGYTRNQVPTRYTYQHTPQPITEQIAFLQNFPQFKNAQPNLALLQKIQAGTMQLPHNTE